MAKSTQTIKSLSAFPFHCPNCDARINGAKLFCSDLCKDEAKFVRYFRACISDGRFDQKDVQDALKIRMAHILAGGYDERLRRIPDSIRNAVIQRDKSKCKICGGPGNQIDHIHDCGNNVDNLQLLCSECHNKKTLANLVKIAPDTHPQEWVKKEKLLARVHVLKPLRLCDSSDWEELWRSLLKARKNNILHK